jgi:hypothetical protein
MYSGLGQNARTLTGGKTPSRTGVAVADLLIQSRKVPALKVFVRDNNVDQALRVETSAGERRGNSQRKKGRAQAR